MIYKKTIRDVRIIYKVTNKLDGRYYIGKCCIPHNHNGNIKAYIIAPTLSTLSEWFGTEIENLTFELLDYNIPHISMEKVLNEYLKNETDPSKLIYIGQKKYVKEKNNKGGGNM